MVWFLVDDNVTFHKKVMDAGNAAFGAWTRAGAWSAANLTNGYIPCQIACRIATRSQVESLLESGLWSRVTNSVTDGYQFHDWQQCQPDADLLKQRREQARRRKARQREREANQDDVTQDVTRDRTRDLARAPDQVPPGPGIKSHQVARARDGAATSAESARGANNYQAIANCDLCDDDGYKKNGTVCDHIDRRFTNARGAKQVRETMGWKT
jgi:hypothetical protein